MDDDEHMPLQSPRTKGIVQAMVREVKKHMEGIDADVQGAQMRGLVCWRPHGLPLTLSLGQWRHPLLVLTTTVLLY
jgi:hypothetical protein